MKNISILGSTGSIGTQTLEIVRENKDKIKVHALSGNSNINLLERQINEFEPAICAVMNKENAEKLKSRISGKTKVVCGMDGLVQSVCANGVDIAVTAISGMIGLKPTIEAIRCGKDIALANKETLVAGGEMVMSLARKHNVNIMPVDSEHSAIFQSLMGNEVNKIKKILLTASGGPFRGKTLKELETVSLADTLNHPNWSMGKKITVDSATLMNKGLEAIEAKWLFDLTPEQIEVVVHPQSIIHSAVEYDDHSVIAQMGNPDMKIPIQLALFYPYRLKNNLKSLDLFEIGKLTFEKPDMNTFKCLKLAFEAMKIGKSMPIVLNKANELAVEMLIRKEIKFLDIQNMVEDIMLRHTPVEAASFDEILEIAKWTAANIKKPN
ncbi:1-deoxy-D-xylulose 5-phosphate reductoisomerase [Dethiosulfatibacter aminovorans DSM 17477]|uniref:1-deoxy-D-xylulose 5-phosphate reductoisomerase n=1 Tax=Dethiosulfatibacter aminovorans DSM 17477 TaxID=1121476 RepID=A0A1M6CXX1_9FIRM|nr:1-deoxy-D-xylulose-5-phosphate reductoisomerase [Dethiosulfatibacter aminovorans]SHI65925.1 1-deoxy-D-xylulose 5-phosphate reductoisomerase [Dethiosulfatibacter aminovorans DSM 17477]